MRPAANFSHARSVSVAIGLGIAFQFAMDALYRYGGSQITQLVFDIGKALDLGGGALRAFVLTAAPGCEAVLLGIVFGVPFGLLLSRHILAYWLLFVSAVIAMNVLTIVMSGSQIGWLVAVWTFPSTWLNMLVILGVAFVAARFHHSAGKLEPNAP